MKAPIIEKMQEYTDAESIHSLSERTGLTIGTLERIISQKRGKQRLNTLDVLYEFF